MKGSVIICTAERSGSSIRAVWGVEEPTRQFIMNKLERLITDN